MEVVIFILILVSQAGCKLPVIHCLWSIFLSYRTCDVSESQKFKADSASVVRGGAPAAQPAEVGTIEWACGRRLFLGSPVGGK